MYTWEGWEKENYYMQSPTPYHETNLNSICQKNEEQSSFNKFDKQVNIWASVSEINSITQMSVLCNLLTLFLNRIAVFGFQEFIWSSCWL